MRHLLIILSLFAVGIVRGQDKILSPVTFQHFTDDLPKLANDADALVLREYGKTQLEVIESERSLMVVHDYSVRIKILRKEGVDHANFEIPLYAFGQTFEQLIDIKGTTYNLKNNGIQTTQLSKDAIFLEKVSSYGHLAKFTLPQVEEGSIIDVQFRVLSPDILNFRTWQFQQDIPKLHSVYTAILPATYQYQVTLRGPYQLTDTKSEILRDHFLLNGVRNDCSKLTYIMDSIPAFKEEDYMLAAKNYKSAISFELEQYFLSNGAKVRVTKEWRDVDRELLSEKSFGGQLKREEIFKDILPPLLQDKQTTLEKAKAIYSYIQRTIKWNEVYGKHTEFGIKESLAQHHGNVADINLAMITALNAASIPAYPILVSTRSNGLPNNLHPVISDFNYVIAGAEIDGKTILLDATDPLSPFGELPLRCVNDKGRIIYSKKSSEWIPLLNEAPSLVTFTFLGELDSAQNLKGKLSISYKGLDALRKRNEIASFPSEEEYFESMESKIPNMLVRQTSLKNLHDIDEILTEQLDIEIPLSDYVHNGVLNFNPILMNPTVRNPFNLTERLYQVDMGSKRYVTHNLNIALPENLTLVSSPKNVNMRLPDEAARYSYQSTLENNRLVFKQTIALNRAIYSVDEYFHLKEFYSRIIQQQNLGFELQKID